MLLELIIINDSMCEVVLYATECDMNCVTNNSCYLYSFLVCVWKEYKRDKMISNSERKYRPTFLNCN